MSIFAHEYMRHALRAEAEPNVIQLVNTELMLSAFFDPAIFGGLLRTFDTRDVRDPARDPAGFMVSSFRAFVIRL